MDLSSLKITPAEGKIALAFLEGEDGQAQSYPSEPGHPDECLLALVTAVGPKVKGVDEGDTVIVSSWARSSPTVGGSTHLVDAYAVLGKITAEK